MMVHCIFNFVVTLATGLQKDSFSFQKELRFLGIPNSIRRASQPTTKNRYGANSLVLSNSVSLKSISWIYSMSLTLGENVGTSVQTTCAGYAFKRT